ncbi:MAG: DUF4192 domain-containing protein [Arachnia propionica]|uniref:DUF4192 domain-containing protein n=1 Tax=Arachnia propionica TaxID=1750 RepID=UPI00270FE2AF|nr:DUF4192 domain-containing protein [Arachnia propionica]
MRPEQARIRSSSQRDLLSVPGVLLGFHPHESCVVLGMTEGTVEFCARADIDRLPSGVPTLLTQLASAIEQSEVDSLVLLAYCADPFSHERFLRFLMDELAGWVVIGLVADDSRFWDLSGPPLADQEPATWDPLSSQVMASAIFQGFPVAADRDEAVAPVRGPSDPASVVPATEAARKDLSGLQRPEKELLLHELLSRTEALEDTEAVRLALLVQDEDLAVQVLGVLDVTSASRLADRLAEARRSVADPDAADVLALLAFACWLGARGAQLAECLFQLEHIAPRHPLFPVLEELHRQATPPPRSNRSTPWG